jgi:hypothetical protein
MEKCADKDLIPAPPAWLNVPVFFCKKSGELILIHMQGAHFSPAIAKSVATPN